MCQLCDETVALIEQTNNAGGTGVFKVVQFTFPGGKPELITTYSKEKECSEETYPIKSRQGT